SRFDGHELPPDSKTGKQTSQAKMDIKIASSHPAPVNAFYELVKGESKYFTGAKISYGAAVQGDSSSKEYTIGVAGVKGRTPDQYTRSPPTFAPPNRKYYPPSKSTTAVREDTPPKDVPDAEDEDE